MLGKLGGGAARRSNRKCWLSVVAAARDGWSGGVGLVAVLQTHLRGPPVADEVWRPTMTWVGWLWCRRRATFVLWLPL